MTRARTEFGFSRTACDCRLCRVFCRHYPGFLIPADLERLVPPGVDPLKWAREHLRARVRAVKRRGSGERSLAVEAILPATTGRGQCHWYKAGHCAVHADAPFGCAFFDQHQSDRQAGRRAENGFAAIRLALDDEHSLYRRLGDSLVSEGLVVHEATLRRAEAAARRELDRIEQDARS